MTADTSPDLIGWTIGDDAWALAGTSATTMTAMGLGVFMRCIGGRFTLPCACQGVGFSAAERGRGGREGAGHGGGGRHHERLGVSRQVVRRGREDGQGTSVGAGQERHGC